MTHALDDVSVAIIDDDAAVRDSLAAVIEVYGCSVRGFESAEQFLNRHEKTLADLLVVDVRLPGMSGLDLLQRLIVRKFTPPCILMTGHADVQTAELSFWPNDICVLPKPCSPELLLETLESFLNR